MYGNGKLFPYIFFKKHTMKKDIEIAREANMLPIEVIASNLGIHKELIETYGKYKAKLPLILIDEKKIKKSSLFL